MKFYRGLINVGKAPVVTEVQRGFKPMGPNKDKQLVQIANAKPLNPMSAAEVVVLRHLHGEGSVKELYEVGEKKQLSFAAERDRLEQIYGEPCIAKVFGVRGSGAKLPREVENIEFEPEGEPIEIQAGTSDLDDDDGLDGDKERAAA